jgi:thioredoxin 1
MIAPHFEALSSKFSKPGKITFAKVDTDRQQEVASMYRVRAMPTFLVLHNGSVVETVQGANPPALAAAVNKGVKLAGSAPGANFSSGGRTLGGEPAGAAARGAKAATAGTSGQGLARPLRWDLNSFINSLIIIVGLYVVSLLTVS